MVTPPCSMEICLVPKGNTQSLHLAAASLPILFSPELCIHMVRALKLKHVKRDSLLNTVWLHNLGEQNDYFNDPNCIGWVRRGTWDKKDGCAVVLR